MADQHGERRSRPIDEPTALRFVGPATAAVVESADFDAADIRSRRVSYRDLVTAGVNPGVAAKLRREYSLVWTFEWEPGADLDRRATLVTGLDPDQRKWVASSGAREDGPNDAGRDWRARDDWVSAALRRDRPSTCPRCGGELARFEFGDQQSIQCESCGYVGLQASVAGRGPDVEEAWAEALDRFERAGRD